jgi:methyl-accepting chemotaxis protein
MMLRGLRARVTAALALCSAATAIFVLIGALRIINGIVDRADQRELHGHYDALQLVLQQEARRAAAMSAVVAQMPSVQQAMQHGDRATLLNLFVSGFAELKAAYGVDQFQFHTPPATSFARIHMPAKFGDDLSSFRKTVVQANADDRTVLGLEGGVAGLGIRGVVPIEDAGSHVGSVEFGLSFGQPFFDEFKRLRHVDIAFHLLAGDKFKTFGGTLAGRSFFTPAQYRAAATGQFQVQRGELAGGPIAALLGPITDFSGKSIGAVEIVMDNRDYVASVDQARRVAVATALLALLLAGLAGLAIARGITRPIILMTDAMRQLAAGDYEVVVPGQRRADEVGRMAAAVDVFRTHAIERARLESGQIQAEQAAQEKRAALLGMAEKIEAEISRALGVIGTRVAAMVQAADDMSASAGRTGASAQGAAGAATQALVNARTVAGAAEGLAASIREVGAQVAASSAAVARAVVAGKETRATMEALNDQVGRIGAVADMIGEVAAKTNLLALNATIEAARAGDAGKGFAVVASEVKQLAAQTARSTAEISRHLGEVRIATGAAVAAVGRIEQTIGEIDGVAMTIAAAVEHQGASTAEIARTVNETAAAANQMSQRIGEVSDEAGQTSEGTSRVRGDTTALADVVAELQKSVVRVVRTATAEVDRREAVPREVDWPCRLTVRGHGVQTARLEDLSAGGASVADGPALPVGSRGTLEADRIGTSLPFVVRAAGDGMLHLAFELDARGTERLGQVLDGAVARNAA